MPDDGPFAGATATGTAGADISGDIPDWSGEQDIPDIPDWSGEQDIPDIPDVETADIPTPSPEPEPTTEQADAELAHLEQIEREAEAKDYTRFPVTGLPPVSTVSPSRKIPTDPVPVFPTLQSAIVKNLTDEKTGKLDYEAAIRAGVRPSYLMARGHRFEDITAAKVYVTKGMANYEDKEGFLDIGKAYRDGIGRDTIALALGDRVAFRSVVNYYADQIDNYISGVEDVGLVTYLRPDKTFNFVDALLANANPEDVIKIMGEGLRGVVNQIVSIRPFIGADKTIAIKEAIDAGVLIDTINMFLSDEDQISKDDIIKYDLPLAVRTGLIEDWNRIGLENLSEKTAEGLKTTILTEEFLNTKAGVKVGKRLNPDKLLVMIKGFFNLAPKPVYAAPPEDEWKINKNGEMEWSTQWLGVKYTFGLGKPDATGLFREGWMIVEGKDKEFKNPSQPCTAGDSCGLEAKEFADAMQFVTEKGGWPGLLKDSPIEKPLGIIRNDIVFKPGSFSTWNEGRTIGKVAGQGSPDLTFREYNTGKRQALSNNDGKSSLVVIGTPSCGACIAEYPTINDYYDRFGGAINVYYVMATAQLTDPYDKRVSNAVIETNPLVDMPVMRMTNREASSLFGVTRTPTTILIDKDGMIVETKLGKFASVDDIAGFTKVTAEVAPVIEPEKEAEKETVIEEEKVIPTITAPSVWDKVQADPEKIAELFKGAEVGALVKDTPEEVDKTISKLTESAKESGIEQWFNEIISKIGRDKENIDKLANVWDKVKEEPPVIVKREIETLADNVSRQEQSKTESASKDIPVWQNITDFFTEPFRALSQGTLSHEQYKALQDRRSQGEITKIITEEDKRNYAPIIEDTPRLPELSPEEAAIKADDSLLSNYPNVTTAALIMEPYREQISDYYDFWHSGAKPEERYYYDLPKAIMDGVPDPVLITIFGKPMVMEVKNEIAKATQLPPAPTLDMPDAYTGTVEEWVDYFEKANIDPEFQAIWLSRINAIQNMPQLGRDIIAQSGKFVEGTKEWVSKTLPFASEQEVTTLVYPWQSEWKQLSPEAKDVMTGRLKRSALDTTMLASAVASPLIWGGVGALGTRLPLYAQLARIPVVKIVPRAAVFLAQITLAGAPVAYSVANVAQHVDEDNLNKKWASFNEFDRNTQNAWAEAAGYKDKDFDQLTNIEKAHVLLTYSLPISDTLGDVSMEIVKFNEMLQKDIRQVSRNIEGGESPYLVAPVVLTEGVVGGFVEGLSYIPQLPIIAAMAVSNTIENDKNSIDTLKAAAIGMAAFFTQELPKAVKEDPVRGVGRITGLFVLSPGLAYQVFKGIGGMTTSGLSPKGLIGMQRALSIEISTPRLFKPKGSVISPEALLTVIEDLAKQSLEGVKDPQVKLGQFTIKMRNVPYQQVLGNNPYKHYFHYTYEKPQFFPEGKSIYLGNKSDFNKMKQTAGSAVLRDNPIKQQISGDIKAVSYVSDKGLKVDKLVSELEVANNTRLTNKSLALLDIVDKYIGIAEGKRLSDIEVKNTLESINRLTESAYNKYKRPVEEIYPNVTKEAAKYLFEIDKFMDAPEVMDLKLSKILEQNNITSNNVDSAIRMLREKASTKAISEEARVYTLLETIRELGGTKYNRADAVIAIDSFAGRMHVGTRLNPSTMISEIAKYPNVSRTLTDIYMDVFNTLRREKTNLSSIRENYKQVEVIEPELVLSHNKLFLAPHGAPAFAKMGAWGQKGQNPAMIEVVTNRFLDKPQKTLGKGEVEFEGFINNVILDPIPGSAGKSSGYSPLLGKYPIRRYTIRGENIDWKGITEPQKSLIEGLTLKETVGDFIHGNYGRLQAIKQLYGKKDPGIKEIDGSISKLKQAQPELEGKHGEVLRQRPAVLHPTRKGVAGDLPLVRSRVTVIVRHPRTGDILLVKDRTESSFGLPGGQIDVKGKFGRGANGMTYEGAAYGQVKSETGIQIGNVKKVGIYRGKVNEFSLSGSRVYNATIPAGRATNINIRAFKPEWARPGEFELKDAIWWDGKTNPQGGIYPASYDILKAAGVIVKNAKINKSIKELNKARDKGFEGRIKKGSTFTEAELRKVNEIEIQRLRQARNKKYQDLNAPPSFREWLTQGVELQPIVDLIKGRRRAINVLRDNKITKNEAIELIREHPEVLSDSTRGKIEKLTKEKLSESETKELLKDIERQFEVERTKLQEIWDKAEALAYNEYTARPKVYMSLVERAMRSSKYGEIEPDDRSLYNTYQKEAYDYYAMPRASYVTGAIRAEDRREDDRATPVDKYYVPPPEEYDPSIYVPPTYKEPPYVPPPYKPPPYVPPPHKPPPYVPPPHKPPPYVPPPPLRPPVEEPPIILPPEVTKVEDLTDEQRKASLAWIQGKLKKDGKLQPVNIIIYPPYDITKNRLYHIGTPPKGVKVHEGPQSAYKSISALKPGSLPRWIDFDMGIMDVGIGTLGPEEGAGKERQKPVLHFKLDRQQATNLNKTDRPKEFKKAKAKKRKNGDRKTVASAGTVMGWPKGETGRGSTSDWPKSMLRG